MQNRKTSNGFTLVEILIVVAIIGILAAVAVPAYFNHILRTRQAEAYHNLLDLKAAQEMFYSMENYYYPKTPPTTLLTGNSLTNLLSFSYSDTKYYRYLITLASGTAFTAKAEGKYGKLAGDVFRIEDDQDPCIESLGNVKLSLGLEPCP
jgi:type IV pilus assembly protein PilE